MYARDAFAENPVWQDVYRSLNQLLGHLHIAILKRDPLVLGGSPRLLDIQLAQARLILQIIQAHCERLDHEDTVLFDTLGILGQVYGPLLGIGLLRQLHKRDLLAYAELLQAYIQLLEEARDEEPESATSYAKHESYKL